MRPNSANRYLDYITDELGEVAIPKQFDLLRLYKGYETNRPYFDIQVIDTQIFTFVDENENETVYIENGIEYIQAEIEYSLGNVVFKHNC